MTGTQNSTATKPHHIQVVWVFFLNPKEQRMPIVVVIKGLELYGYTIKALHCFGINLSIQPQLVIFIEMPFLVCFQKYFIQFYMHKQIKIFTLKFSMFKCLALKEINDVFCFLRRLRLNTQVFLNCYLQTKCLFVTWWYTVELYDRVRAAF